MVVKSLRCGAVNNTARFVSVVLSSLLYQAAIGGLFFLLAKHHGGGASFTSLLLMVEPLLLLAFGVRFAKKIDSNREHLIRYTYKTAYFTFAALIVLYCLRSSHPALVLASFALVMSSFMRERILRQRLPRDFAQASGMLPSRVAAITSLANRGAPVLSPMVIYLFPFGLTSQFLFIFF